MIDGFLGDDNSRFIDDDDPFDTGGAPSPSTSPTPTPTPTPSPPTPPRSITLYCRDTSTQGEGTCQEIPAFEGERCESFSISYEECDPTIPPTPTRTPTPTPTPQPIIIFCKDTRELDPANQSCLPSSVPWNGTCSNVSPFHVDCDPDEDVPPETEPLPSAYCCQREISTDALTGIQIVTNYCKTDCIEVNNISSCDQLGTIRLNNGQSVVKYIECDPANPPSKPEPEKVFVTKSVNCSPDGTFEQCKNYDIIIEEGTDDTPTNLCKLASNLFGGTVSPCDPTRVCIKGFIGEEYCDGDDLVRRFKEESCEETVVVLQANGCANQPPASPSPTPTITPTSTPTPTPTPSPASRTAQVTINVIAQLVRGGQAVNDPPSGEVSVRRTTFNKPLEQQEFAIQVARLYDIGDSITIESRATDNSVYFLRWRAVRASGIGISAGTYTASSPSNTIGLHGINFPGIEDGEIITFIAEFEEPIVPTPTPTSTPTPTPIPNPEPSPTPSPSPFPELVTPSPTPTPSQTSAFELPPQPEPSSTPSPTPTPIIQPTPLPSTTPSPSPTPSTSRIYTLPPDASPLPSSTPFPTPTRTPTPQPSVTPAPSPTPTPLPRWRSCIDGKLYLEPKPRGYRVAIYEGVGGGECWEPVTEVEVHPNINNTIFTYRRGSSELPSAKKFTIDNPSYAVYYAVRILTNEDLFRVEPRQFQLAPRNTQDFTISVREEAIESFGDGGTIFDLQLELREI
jgi:hypothetical protein